MRTRTPLKSWKSDFDHLSHILPFISLITFETSCWKTRQLETRPDTEIQIYRTILSIIYFFKHLIFLFNVGFWYDRKLVWCFFKTDKCTVAVAHLLQITTSNHIQAFFETEYLDRVSYSIQRDSATLDGLITIFGAWKPSSSTVRNICWIRIYVES